MAGGKYEFAKVNCSKHFPGIQNAVYGCGRVESSTTWQELKFDPSEELVAVVNPSRGGLGMNFITARKRNLGQGNIFSSVCQEFCSQWGGSASVHAGIPHPLPPGADPHPGTRHPPGPGPSADQTPPSLRSACLEIRSTSGRYAFYWNAILFSKRLSADYQVGKTKYVLTYFRNLKTGMYEKAGEIIYYRPPTKLREGNVFSRVAAKAEHNLSSLSCAYVSRMGEYPSPPPK